MTKVTLLKAVKQLFIYNIYVICIMMMLSLGPHCYKV